MPNFYYVYLHRTLRGRVFYVGKGKGRRAWSSSSRSDVWKTITEDCGLIVDIVIDGLSQSEAYAIECQQIAFYKSLGFELCNKTIGGGGAKGRISSEETKRKIGAANKIALKGQSIPLGTRIAISKALKGRSLSEEHRKNLTGKQRSDAHRDALSKSLKGNKNGLGKKKTAEHVEAATKALRLRWSKPVLCLELNRHFNAVRDAAEFVRPGSKLADGNIVACCKGRLTKAYGYTWKYI